MCVEQTQLSAPNNTDPLPPLLLPHHTSDLLPNTVKYLIELWGREGEFSDIDGVPFGHAELVRLFHFRGAVAYIVNDNIVDCFSNLLNMKESDFWVMPSHLYGKYMKNDPLDRWVGRSMKVGQEVG